MSCQIKAKQQTDRIQGNKHNLALHTVTNVQKLNINTDAYIFMFIFILFYIYFTFYNV